MQDALFIDDVRRPRMKASDAELSNAYAELGSIWKVAERFGMGGQSVHERLSKLGVVQPINVFSPEETARLDREYLLFSKSGRLDVLAASMGRSKHLICRKARELGLTSQKHPRPWLAVWKYITDEAAAAIWEDFKASPLGLGAYCKKRGYDDLGFANALRGRYADEWEHVIEIKQPKQTMYRFGREFEYRVRDDLKKAGYFVMRSPASKSPVDLCAIRHGASLLVQCKRGGSLPVSEWNALFDLAESVGATPVLAVIPASRRGCQYFRLIGRKDGTKRRQPMEPMEVG